MTTTQQLKDLLGRATPPPWYTKYGPNVHAHRMVRCADRALRVMEASVYVFSSNTDETVPETNQTNANLTCEAVNALPALLAVVEAAENVRAEWTSKHVIKTPLDRRMAELIAALAALNTEQKTNG